MNILTHIFNTSDHIVYFFLLICSHFYLFFFFFAGQKHCHDCWPVFRKSSNIQLIQNDK